MSLSNASKNNVSLTNEDLSASPTIDEMVLTIDDVVRPIDYPGTPIIKATKNNSSLSNASENQV